MATEKVEVRKTFVSHKITDKWRTPPTVIEWLAQWLGRKFALDAFAADGTAVGADYFTADRPAPIADWGKDWWFANPCYSRRAFASHVHAILANAHRPGVALVRSDLGTSSGAALLRAASGVILWPERMAFYDRMGPVRGSNFSNALLIYGDRAHFADRPLPRARSQRAKCIEGLQPEVLWK